MKKILSITLIALGFFLNTYPVMAVRAPLPESALEQSATLVVEATVLAVVLTREEIAPKSGDGPEGIKFRHFRAFLAIQKVLKGEERATLEYAWTEKLYPPKYPPMPGGDLPSAPVYPGAKIKAFLRGNKDLKAWEAVDYSGIFAFDKGLEALPCRVGEYLLAPQPDFKSDSRKILSPAEMQKIQQKGPGSDDPASNPPLGKPGS
jgi:hypothetical protein